MTALTPPLAETRKRTSTEFEKPTMSFSEKMALNYGTEAVKPKNYTEKFTSRVEEPKEDVSTSSYVWEELSPTKKSQSFIESPSVIVKSKSISSEDSEEQYEEEEPIEVMMKPSPLMTQASKPTIFAEDHLYSMSQPDSLRESPTVNRRVTFPKPEEVWKEDLSQSETSSPIYGKPLSMTEVTQAITLRKVSSESSQSSEKADAVETASPTSPEPIYFPKMTLNLDLTRSNIISGLGIESESESSSSEEDVPKAAPEPVKAYVKSPTKPISEPSLPSTSISAAKPNSSSKAMLIERKETKGGLNPNSRSGGCSACHLF
mmetsp:Transcript_28731/g.51128  ORF Transcript_28731/g.51128 Transcript_28731/m.51128 type:complete len:318 (+) Transcript_28731:178-1131(+)